MSLFMNNFPAGRASAAMLLAAGMLLCGCGKSARENQAAIAITQAPPQSPGGPDKMDFIQGKVTGAKPGEQVVLYARSNIWWIQPVSQQPFTSIQPDSTWRNSTHLGTEYAALLVEPGYKPTFKTTALPGLGNGVVAVALAKGAPSAPIVSKVIHFSGYDWMVRVASSDRGGEANAYDADNAWVDEKGYLHLRMNQLRGRWSCAEVSLNRSLGYGTYRFTVQDTGHLGPSAVVGMFTWDDVRSGDFKNELDIELSRWGKPGAKNAQYVVQPFYVPQNVARFNTPAGRVTHMFSWYPDRADFKSVRGDAAKSSGPAISEHVFTSGIPTPASETVHIDLYDFRHSKLNLQQPAEVVFEKFEYFP